MCHIRKCLAQNIIFMKILLLILIFVIPNSLLVAQDIPDCMCPPQYWIETGVNIINFDSSLVIDTCGIPYWYNSCDSMLWDN